MKNNKAIATLLNSCIKEEVYCDKNGKVVESGSIIDLHQTVNGQSTFVILSLNPLDIRYSYDLSRKYEYDKKELLLPDKFSNVEFEIVGSIKVSLIIKGETICNFDYKTIII